MKAQYVKEVIVIDPDSKGEVAISIFKHESGGMFGVDSSYLDQAFDDEAVIKVPNVFGGYSKVVLMGLD